MDANLRNLKDFLTLYNKITEICFGRCVDNLFDRNLGTEENTCVERCVLKFAAFNHKMMNVYVEVQTEINQKRIEELEQQQQQQQQQTPEKQNPQLPTTSVPTSGDTQTAYA